MALVSFFDKKLSQANYKMSTLFAGHYQVVTPESGFLDQSTIMVKDINTNETYTLDMCRSDVDKKQRIENYRNFLEASTDFHNFPKIVTEFDYGVYTGVVCTYIGNSMHTILKSYTFQLSHENCIRLAYQLFHLVNEMHVRGYVHRNIDLGSVRIGLDRSGECVAQLHRFWYTAPMYPPPSSYGMSSWRFQSLQVNCGSPYQRADDFISSLFVVMRAYGIHEFNRTVGKSIIEHKEEFGGDMENLIKKPKLAWIGKVYSALCHQRVHGIKLDVLWDLLDNALKNFDPSSPMEWSYVKSEETGEQCVKLNTEPNDDENAYRPLHKQIHVPQ